MKNTLSKLSFIIDNYIDRLGKSVSWLTVILMLLICVDVTLRYMFNNTKTWIIELEWHLFSVIFLIGASYTLLHDKHVRVDLFYEKFSSGTKARVNLIGMLLFVIPWSVVIILNAWDYALNSFSFRETSSQPNGLPARYIIKAFISLGFVLIVIQAISQIIKATVRRRQE